MKNRVLQGRVLSTGGGMGKVLPSKFSGDTFLRCSGYSITIWCSFFQSRERRKNVNRPLQCSLTTNYNYYNSTSIRQF